GTKEADVAVHLKRDRAYQIPYRCLIPKKIDNLLVAGRCISTTREANGSTRVMPICMALGQAAGTAAALAVRHKVSPRNLDISILQKRLLEQGAKLE
ncbi:MAG: FAD-dependent oxidoreductase, partial [Candidatus Eisenbacteria sp.]|nr:FAD-dependent oxidoreductase [Candidatus Eisenbacteria bacterium]